MFFSFLLLAVMKDVVTVPEQLQCHLGARMHVVNQGGPEMNTLSVPTQNRTVVHHRHPADVVAFRVVQTFDLFIPLFF